MDMDAQRRSGPRAKPSVGAKRARTGSNQAAPLPADAAKGACACGGGCPRCLGGRIQPKLSVSQSGDPLERDADRIADRVLSAQPAAAPRADAGALAGRGDDLAPAGGRPLERAARAFMEERFGADLGAVRIHTGQSAAQAASRYRARAYTAGRNIVFGDGEYAPGSADGRRLLAHELAHVAQQGGAASASAPAIQRDGFGDVRIAEGRDEAEAALPAKFPSSGVRVIGPGAADLAGILASCTGLDVSIGKGDMLEVKEPATARAGTFSASAKIALKSIATLKDGIIIDTDPKGPAVEIGTFAMMTPGYQHLDIGNIKVLAAATGENGGIGACDAVMHEMAEAAFARTFSLQKTANIGQTAYVPAHAEGIRVEEGIRKDFGLPQRSATEAGSMAVIGNEDADTKVYLDAMVYGDGKNAKTQLTVYRCHIMMISATEGACDNEAVASTVVKGVVKFSTQMEALKLFNKHASAFGLQPIAVPKPPKKAGKGGK